MTALKFSGKLILLIAVLSAWLILPACTEIETDPKPPYPVKDNDYNYPEDEVPPPPWEDPENYPLVTITQPADGAVVEPGAVTVSGTYQGPDLTSFEVNGRTVSVNGSTFSTTVNVDAGNRVMPIVASATATNVYENEIVSADRVTVFVGQAKAIDSVTTDALIVDLENTGLGEVSDLLSAMLDDLDITGLIAPENKAEVIFINRAYLGNTEVDLSSQADGLAINLLANGVELDITLLGMDIGITINGLVLDLLSTLEIDGTDIALDIVDGNMSIADFNIDSNLIPDFVDTLVELLAPTLYDLLLQNLLLDTINGLLADLNLEIDGGDFIYQIAPTSFTTTDRNLEVALATKLTLNETNPGFQPGGYFTVAGAAPVFGELTPDAALPYGIGLALNDDMLNQIFYGLAASGTFDLELTDPIMTAEIFSLLFFSFKSIDQDTPILIRLTPSVAPAVVADGSSMLLKFPNWNVQMIVDRGTLGEWEAMSWALDITAPLDVKVNDDKSISLMLSDLLLELHVEHNSVGQVNVERINRLLDEALQGQIPDLLGMLAGLKIRLPEIAGLQIDLSELSAFGESQDFLGVFIDLQY